MDVISQPDSKILELVTKSNEVLLKNKKGGSNMQNLLTKKNLLTSVLIASMIVLLSMFVFSACGGGTNVLGTWKLDRVVEDGKTYKASDTDKGAYAQDFGNVLIFNEDKTASVKIKSDSATNATWKQTKTEITVTADNNDTTYTLSGDELIYDKDGVRYFYKKST
jgi:uncharacterized cupin superfamily protein